MIFATRLEAEVARRLDIVGLFALGRDSREKRRMGGRINGGMRHCKLGSSSSGTLKHRSLRFPIGVLGRCRSARFPAASRGRRSLRFLSGASPSDFFAGPPDSSNSLGLHPSEIPSVVKTSRSSRGGLGVSCIGITDGKRDTCEALSDQMPKICSFSDSLAHERHPNGGSGAAQDSKSHRGPTLRSVRDVDRANVPESSLYAG